MNVLKKHLIGAAALVAMGAASTAQAGVVIDLFIDPVGSTQTVETEIKGATVSDQNLLAYPNASVLGGYRDLSIKKTEDTSGSVNTGRATLQIDSGTLSLSNAVGVTSTGVVTWDGSNNAGALGTSVNGSGLGGIDLTAGGTANQIFADVLSADLGFNYKIKVWDMDGSIAELSAGVQFQVNSTISSTYLLSWFNLADGTYCDGGPAPCASPFQLDFKIERSGNGGDIDFTKVGALQLTLEGTRGDVDLALGTVKTVPEPGALALAGMALLGAGFASRRRNTKG